MSAKKDSVISIIIPAHNEEQVILRCLKHLSNGIDNNKVEIIVVCNGCTDNTAKNVKDNFSDIIVIETDIASKTNALNLGDEIARGFPRFYVDADILIDGASIMKMADLMDKSGILAASPKLNIVLNERPWSIKAFYNIWAKLPYVQNEAIGSGVYALSQQGRGRFQFFPSLIGDDAYVRCLFLPNERKVMEDVNFTIFPPNNILDLIKIKSRVKAGNHQLKNIYPELFKENLNSTSTGKALSLLCKEFYLWPSIFVYIIVSMLSLVFGSYKFYFQKKIYWNKDSSSRKL